LSHRFEPSQPAIDDLDEARFNDDQLRLIFTCCHPAISPDVQVALTLREVCGLKTEEVASAFLTTAPTIAQRIVRGKAKIRDTNIPFVVPPIEELPDRLDSVLAVVYLVFNEGYSASSGDSVVRGELSGEAIRLGRLLVELLPDAEAMGLLALMLLHESRRTARMDAAGDLVLLEDQDRSKWNQMLIREGREWVARAMATGPIGTYTIQAAISAVHAVATTPDATDWNQIVGLYDLLLRASPSPIVELNRAVALAMRDGYETGVAAIDAIFERGELAGYHLAHAARGDLCRRMGRVEEARTGFQRAYELAQQEPERRFLARRLAELAGGNT
jgi:RNA polymerase sigma-70 factor (ECF subfamily)